MSTKVWQGGAQAIAQVNTVTPSVPAVGNTFTITINGKSFTWTAGATTVADVTAGLAALLNASQEGDVTELTAVDLTTAVQITGPLDGTPFTQTSSAAAGTGGGSPTLTTVTTTAGQSPYDWSVAANWQGGAVPVAADDVVADGTSVPILFGLDQHTITLNSLTIGTGFTGTIGLPPQNPKGYTEYRTQYLRVGATTCQIGQGPQTGGGSGRLKIDFGTAQTTLTVYSTGQSADSGLPAMLFKGSHASNAVSVIAGSVGLAVLPGETATVAALRVGGAQQGQTAVVAGSGLSLTTLNMDGGTCQIACGLATLNQVAGTLTLTGTGAISTVANVDGGTLVYQSSGTIASLKVSDGGTADFRTDPRARTVTAFTVDSGGAMYDSLRTVTWTAGPILNRCSLADVTLDFGTHLQLTVAAGP
jgi:hypothetical protein